ncbi:MAG: dTMP kinase [Alphaproteobacteria bacterium]
MAGPGRFITLEGGEGAGKTTQLNRLAGRLRTLGLDVVETREPGGTAGADAIRNLVVEGDGDRWDATSEALLMYAARRDHVVRRIRPALNSGAWVLCDRFSDSTMAYQGYAHGLGVDWIEKLNRLVLEGFQPDLTIVLDLPVDVGLRRAAERGGPDRFERLGQDFHNTLRQAFLEIAKHEPERVRVIDAEAPPDKIDEAVFRTVRDHFGLNG